MWKKMLMVGVVVLGVGCVRANAQPAPFPGAVQINGGWVPCSHPVAIAEGKGCVDECVEVAGARVCDASECVGLNPYRQGAQAAACAEWFRLRAPAPPPPVRVFAVGALYTGAYPSFRMRVLSITRDSQGREVVTGEWVSGNTGVFAMVNAPGVDQPIRAEFWQ